MSCAPTVIAERITAPNRLNACIVGTSRNINIVVAESVSGRVKKLHAHENSNPRFGRHDRRQLQLRVVAYRAPIATATLGKREGIRLFYLKIFAFWTCMQ